jgi:hypothetical protein
LTAILSLVICALPIQNVFQKLPGYSDSDHKIHYAPVETGHWPPDHSIALPY